MKQLNPLRTIRQSMENETAKGPFPVSENFIQDSPHTKQMGHQNTGKTKLQRPVRFKGI